MTTLILIRHGQSIWNKKNLFTGWVDVPLSSQGIQEALEAGNKIKDFPIHEIYISTLIRAQMTAMLAMASHGSGKTPLIQHEEGPLHEWGQIYSEKSKEDTIPVYAASELNERMYGELQGLDKAETAEKYGKEQVHIWRRSFSTPPPNGESLELTAKRTLPYFRNVILPKLVEGKTILVSAHGNSLRSIVMDLDSLSEKEVLALEIPTGDPIIYQYTNGHFSKQ